MLKVERCDQLISALAPWRFEWLGAGITAETPSSKSAAHRDKSREWFRLKANLEPLLTVNNSGYLEGDAAPGTIVY